MCVTQMVDMAVSHAVNRESSFDFFVETTKVSVIVDLFCQIETIIILSPFQISLQSIIQINTYLCVMYLFVKSFYEVTHLIFLR